LRLTPAEALDRYLSGTGRQEAGCAPSVFAVQIDASLPKLRKQGSMSGLKLVCQGQTAYRDLQFTGDNLVKTAVIARFLTRELRPPDVDTAVTGRNYAFIYERTSVYNGITAYVYLLKPKPKRNRKGLFAGELWLEAEKAAPLRLWGDLIKTPSFFIRHFRFVQDYQRSEPVRLLVIVQTRLVGEAELAERLHAIGAPVTMAGTGACGADQAASQGAARRPMADEYGNEN
jgi:hypothetical protein